MIRRIGITVLLGVFVAVSVSSVVALKERNNFASKQLASLAREAIENGEHDLAMLLALEALPAGKGQLMPMDSLQARFVLNEARRKNGLVGIYGEDVHGKEELGPFSQLKPFAQRRLSLDGTLRLEPRCEQKYHCFVDIIKTETDEVHVTLGRYVSEAKVATFTDKDSFVITGYDVGLDDDISRRFNRHYFEYEGKPGNSNRISREGDLHPDLFYITRDESGAYFAQRESNRIIAWDLKGDFPESRIDLHGADIVALFPVEHRSEVVVVSKEGLISVWPMDIRRIARYEAKPLRHYRTNLFGVTVAEISEDGRHLQLQSAEGKTRLVSLEDGYPPTRVDLSSGYQGRKSGEISPDGRILIRWADEVSAEVINLQTKKVLAQFDFPNVQKPIFSFSPDGKFLFTSTNDQEMRDRKWLRVWQVSDFGLSADLPVPIVEQKLDAASLYSSYVSFDNQDRVWFGVVRTVNRQPHAALSYLDLADGSLQETDLPVPKSNIKTTNKGILGIWQVLDSNGQDSHLMGYIDFQSEKIKWLEMPSGATDIRFGGSHGGITSDGSIAYLRLKRNGEGVQFYWSMKNGKLLGSFPFGRDVTKSFVFNDGRVLMSFYDEGDYLFLGSIKEGASRKVDTSHIDVVDVFGIDANKNIALLKTKLGKVAVFDFELGLILRRFAVPNSDIHYASLSSDRAWVATTSDDGLLRIWDVKDGSILATIDGHGKGREQGYLNPAWDDHHFLGPLIYDTSSEWHGFFTRSDESIIAVSEAYGTEIWSTSHDDDLIASACASLSENRRRLSDAEYARYGIKAREAGPCERVGPLSLDYWQ